MKNHYLTEETKKQLIEVLSEEYEKILISETISKSKASAIEKQQIAELMNYLQTQNNISYLELNERLKWPGLGKILGKVGRVVFGPIGTGIGTAIDAWNFAKNPKQWWKDFQDDYVVPDPPSGPNWPSDWKETGIMEETNDYGSDDIPPGGLDEKISYENRVNVIDRLISEMNTSLVMESAELRNVFIEAISAFKDTNSTYRTVLEQFGERFFTTYIPASTFGIGENENYEQSNTELPPPENLPESMKVFWKQRLGNQLNEKKGVGSVLGKVLGPLGVAFNLYDLYDIYKNPQNYPAPKSPQGPPPERPTSNPPQIAPKY